MADILHVDDEDTIRRLMPHILYGHTVTSVESMDDAVRELGRGRFDLVLTDYDLKVPNKTGIDLVEYMQQQGFAMPVVLISSNVGTGFGADQSRYDQLYANGVGQIKAVVNKPFRNDDLLAAVNTVLISPIVSPSQPPSGPGTSGMTGQAP